MTDVFDHVDSKLLHFYKALNNEYVVYIYTVGLKYMILIVKIF